MPINYIKYELYSDELGLLELKNDPIGWQTDEKTLQRSTASESFFTRFSKDITFIKDGASYITLLLNSFGTKPDLVCRRFEISPVTDDWVKVYDENLDLESYEFEKDKVKISFLSGGLNDVLKAQWKEKFQLHRKDSIEEKSIGSLSYESLGITGRKILLTSFLKNDEGFNKGFDDFYFSFDQNLQYKNDDQVDSIVNFQNNFIGESNTGFIFFDETQVLYKNTSGKDRTLKITFKAKGSYLNSVSGNARNMEFVVAKNLKYNTNELQWDGLISDFQVIKRFDSSNSSQSFDFDVNETFTINVPNETGFSVFLKTTQSGQSNSIIIVDKEGISTLIEEDSTYVPTKAKGLLFKNALIRTLQIITGRTDVLKSDLFTTGQWENIFLTSGILLREFPETQYDDNGELIQNSDGTTKTNGITTSLEELLSIKAHLNIGWGVERVNGQEFFRVEPLEYFFPDKVTIRLKGKFCPNRKIASEFIFGSIELGNSKAGDYEEQQGLYEHNTLTNWTTSNIKSSNELSVETTLRTDLIGMEFARRKAFRLSSTEDTKYDNNNFIFHVAQVTYQNYRIRTWQFDFATQPTQVYDPDSAGNLLLSPLRSLERHGWMLNSSLFIYPNENILFSSSNGNSNMITQIAGEIPRGENQPYRNGDLKRPRFIYQYLDFDFPNDFETKLAINGTFMENDNIIPNYYGLVEFTNEDDELEHGWILKVVENDLGSFRLIKSYR